MKCLNEDGGFGASEGHDSHLLYTLSAVQILATYDALEETLGQDNKVEKVAKWVARLQLEDGSFQGDPWGEIDTRFSYCAVSCLSILHRLESIDRGRAADFILRCHNFDGGFGARPGDETHAGQIFWTRGSAYHVATN